MFNYNKQAKAFKLHGASRRNTSTTKSALASARTGSTTINVVNTRRRRHCRMQRRVATKVKPVSVRAAQRQTRWQKRGRLASRWGRHRVTPATTTTARSRTPARTGRIVVEVVEVRRAHDRRRPESTWGGSCGRRRRRGSLQVTSIEARVLTEAEATAAQVLTAPRAMQHRGPWLRRLRRRSALKRVRQRHALFLRDEWRCAWCVIIVFVGINGPKSEAIVAGAAHYMLVV